MSCKQSWKSGILRSVTSSDHVSYYAILTNRMIIMTESRAIGEWKLGWLTWPTRCEILVRSYRLNFFSGTEQEVNYLDWHFSPFYNFFYIISYLAL